MKYYTIHNEEKHSTVEADGTIRVTVPMTVWRRGGRKYVLTPQEGQSEFVPAKINHALVKALARAFRWEEQILTRGVTIRQIAAGEKIVPSYVSKVLRLTILSPAIIEAILTGRQPKTLELEDLFALRHDYWSDQHKATGLRVPVAHSH